MDYANAQAPVFTDAFDYLADADADAWADIVAEYSNNKSED